MSKLIIDQYQNINSMILDQAKDLSPWDWLRLDFDDPYTNNKYIHFLKSQLIGILTSHDNELLSFAWFGQDDWFNPYIANIVWSNHNESCFFMYFFTPEKLRGKWYGKTLYQSIITYLQSTWKYQYMNYTTVDINNVTRYKKRWAEQKKKENLFDNKKEYYLTHSL